MNANILQVWGAVRGVAIAVGGMLLGMGVLKMSPEDLSKLLDSIGAIVTAVAGLVVIAAPMVQGWRARSTNQAAQAVAGLPGIRGVVADIAIANAVPSPNVVPPQAAATLG